MSEFDTERFIIEIEARPAIWNFQSPEYSNKHQKHQSWGEVCAVIISGYKEMEVADKANKCKLMQRKWRSLRDCYTRELNAQTQTKSGSARVERKQYIFFNQLSFLRQSVEKRKKKSSLDEEQNTSITGNVDEVNDSELTALGTIQEDQDENVIQISPQPTPQPTTVSQPIEKFDVRPPTVTSRKRSQEHVAATELKVLQDISKRFCQKSTEGQRGDTNKAEEDEDRLFLLSLLSDVKKVHEDDKLELKSEIILLIKKWQKARQTQNQLFTTVSNNFQWNNGKTNIQGNSYSHAISGEKSNQQYQQYINRTYSSMPSFTSSTVPIPSGSQRSSVQSPSLLQCSTVRSPDFSETSCESPY